MKVKKGGILVQWIEPLYKIVCDCCPHPHHVVSGDDFATAWMETLAEQGHRAVHAVAVGQGVDMLSEELPWVPMPAPIDRAAIFMDLWYEFTSGGVSQGRLDELESLMDRVWLQATVPEHRRIMLAIRKQLR